MKRLVLLLSTLLLPAMAAVAQTAAPRPAPPNSDQPAVNTSGGDIPPASQAGGASRPTAPRSGNSAGTSIIGERESPIGLYITPWRNSAPEADIDRPARLLSVQLEPVDRKVFARQVEYFDALTAAQKAKVAPAPSEPQAQP